MRSVTLHVGPARFRIGSAWNRPIAALRRLYAHYPAVGEKEVPDFTVRLEPFRPWRRWIRPAILTGGDYRLADAAPLPLGLGLLAAEMGMNLQMALGWRRHLVLHASSVERDGQALVMCGESGSGKSTLAAMLGERGWRLMGDEFALVDPATGEAMPFPRPVSLKNESIAAMERVVGGTAAQDRFGPLLPATPKGDIRHLVPRREALAAMESGAQPALLLFPRFGQEAAVRPMPTAEALVRLTQASPNYTAMGEAGFMALTRFVAQVPAMAMDFPDGAAGLDMVEQLWSGR